MIETAASKSFATERVRVRPKTISPLLWLNLVCLDAPLVAVSWHWLFARTFAIAIPTGATAALFLTAWAIYLADRLGDALSLGTSSDASLRQEFCGRHRRMWMAAVALVALTDMLVVLTRLDRKAILAGAIVGLCALLYLLLNRRWPSLWRALPLKEISIGFVFAAGVLVGLFRGLTSPTLPAWLLFAAVCALNCICIAVWERELDLAQGRISIATEFRGVDAILLPALAVICLTSAIAAISGRSAVFLCLAGSAWLLGAVHLFRRKIASDVRTALADLVLLTPIAVFFSSV